VNKSGLESMVAMENDLDDAKRLVATFEVGTPLSLRLLIKMRAPRVIFVAQRELQASPT